MRGVLAGGTRGIGAAISKALKAAGYKVAASYAGNDEAAAKFKAETGIPVYKWDVASFDACADGVKKVEAELGPIDVLMTRRAMRCELVANSSVAVLGTGVRRGLRGMTRRWRSPSPSA